MRVSTIEEAQTTPRQASGKIKMSHTSTRYSTNHPQLGRCAADGPELVYPSDMRWATSLPLLALILMTLPGCVLGTLDDHHVLIRSDVITSVEQEREILSKASLRWSKDGRVRVLVVRGTPYERGYQHGALLRPQVQDNLRYLYAEAQRKFRSAELFDEAYERMRPFIPQEYIEEMHGLAHGAKLPLRLVHAIHALPEVSEWGGKKRLRELAHAMLRGADLGTSCSNFNALNRTPEGEEFYAVRILDWGLHRISKLHEYPLLLVSHPDQGVPSVNITWVGFIGAVSGMNAEGITLGEMGNGDPEGETLRGVPMPFLLRRVLDEARNLSDVRRIIGQSPGTNSFAYLMTDGKTRESELYLRDRSRFEVFGPGSALEDRGKRFPAVVDTVYGGHYDERMAELLTRHQGAITPELLQKELIPAMAMASNFQNVIYDPVRLRLWVSNAADRHARAAEQPYTPFDLAAELRARHFSTMHE